VIRDTGDLPDDVTTLQALLLAERARTARVSEELAAIRAETASYKAQIEHLKAQLARLRRSQFGRSSEKLDQQIAQLELVLEDLEESAAQDEAKDAAAEESSSDQTRPAAKRRKPAVRQPLPEHLPRETVELEAKITCTCWQPELTRIGEDVTEVLETIPAQLKVIRYVRPKLACRACQAVFQAPSPDLPISKGRPGPDLIAQVIHVEVRRWAAALSPIRDLRSAGPRNRPPSACRLDGPCCLVAGRAGGVINRMAKGHLVNRLAELLPWNWKATQSAKQPQQHAA
jgi:transposase